MSRSVQKYLTGVRSLKLVLEVEPWGQHRSVNPGDITDQVDREWSRKMLQNLMVLKAHKVTIAPALRCWERTPLQGFMPEELAAWAKGKEEELLQGR